MHTVGGRRRNNVTRATQCQSNVPTTKNESVVVQACASRAGCGGARASIGSGRKQADSLYSAQRLLRTAHCVRDSTAREGLPTASSKGVLAPLRLLKAHSTPCRGWLALHRRAEARARDGRECNFNRGQANWLLLKQKRLHTLRVLNEIAWSSCLECALGAQHSTQAKCEACSACASSRCVPVHCECAIAPASDQTAHST